MIDTHCHFDMMANPGQYIQDAENRGDIIIGMTNLPSHFQMGISHLEGFKRIRLALGLHPQLAHEALSELELFDSLIDKTSYIGEIGLDFSKDSYRSKETQVECLRHILHSLNTRKKIISVHSRRAEKELFALLKEYNIKNVVFHWYSGPIDLIPDIIGEGYYFSINEAMTLSPNGKRIIAAIPRDRVLTETDAPFNEKCSIENVMHYMNLVEGDIKTNFNRLLANLRN